MATDYPRIDYIDSLDYAHVNGVDYYSGIYENHPVNDVLDPSEPGNYIMILGTGGVA